MNPGRGGAGTRCAASTHPSSFIPHPFQERAFTLVELLVVLAVLAVLAGLLLPVFGSARERGRQAACASNERQLGHALNLYLQDYDERFPQSHPATTPWSFPEDEITVVTPWRNLMEPYARDARLYKCPSDWGAPDWHPTSYAPNGYTAYGASLAEVSAPAATVYLGELQPGALLDDISPWLGAGTLRDDVLAATRHSGSANYLYVDGHAASKRFEKTWSPVNQWVLTR